MTASEKLNLFSLRGKNRVLHLTWFAFFLVFVVWFNHAPLMASIQASMGLSEQQVKILLILNVALTIPARIIIGMLVDRVGPRLVYFMLLLVSGFVCLFFALAETFETLAFWRFLLGFVGAGFVIGVRVIGEWFPAKEVGFAQGIYGGWGNFGSAAAAMSLPALALLFGGADGWRYAVGITGGVMLLYAFVYYFSVADTPRGTMFSRSPKVGALEARSKADLAFYLLLNIPLYGALALLTRALGTLGLLSQGAIGIVGLVLISAYIVQSYRIYQINAAALRNPGPTMHSYRFKQVAILSFAYLVTFGAEIAVVSMLPLFFKETFDMSLVQAGVAASSFAFMSLIARPLGGLLSDRYGRKRTLAFLLAGLAIGFQLMSLVGNDWPLILVMLVTVSCAAFVLGGAGAVFAIVPLIHRPLTGHIAGIVGAYGSAGGVFFLTVLSFASPSVFFLVIALAAFIALGAVLSLDELQEAVAEELPGGQAERR
ncbi:MAG: MFS transporter [Pseudomonadota bacterium]|nr:MFS transporter [Pseudomonadota bacterium]